MSRRIAAFVSLLCLVIGPSALAECKSARLGIPDQAKFNAFFERFQKAVKAGDSKEISGMAAYPVVLRSKLGEFRFKNASEFKSVMSLLLQNRVKELIAKKSLKDLSCDSKEVHFQGGKLGLQWADERISVTSITID